MTTSSEQQVRVIVEEVISEAHDRGQRPSVLTAAKLAGMPNTTFRRRYPALTALITTARRDPAAPPQQPHPIEALTATNSRLTATNRDLKAQLALAAATIQRLTIENTQLRAQLPATGNVRALPTRPNR